ncbi:MAG: hypothetical protein H6937_09600 [Burkholderiales bacterium]|nr:hypothetical protein [Burkholderiales bacterium]MDR4517603.1 hypothetical protein [Nitrosomonas sp.]
MKNTSTIIAVGILALLFSGQISAAGYGGQTDSMDKAQTESIGKSDYLSEAIKHAEMAQANNADAKKILQHAEKSLAFDRKAEKQVLGKGNSKEAEHITASIKHLEEAIKHAKMGHANVASLHVNDALKEMHQFTAN